MKYEEIVQEAHLELQRRRLDVEKRRTQIQLMVEKIAEFEKAVPPVPPAPDLGATALLTLNQSRVLRAHRGLRIGVEVAGKNVGEVCWNGNVWAWCAKGGKDFDLDLDRGRRRIQEFSRGESTSNPSRREAERVIQFRLARVLRMKGRPPALDSLLILAPFGLPMEVGTTLSAKPNNGGTTGTVDLIASIGSADDAPICVFEVKRVNPKARAKEATDALKQAIRYAVSLEAEANGFAGDGVSGGLRSFQRFLNKNGRITFRAIAVLPHSLRDHAIKALEDLDAPKDNVDVLLYRRSEEDVSVEGFDPSGFEFLGNMTGHNSSR